MKDLASDPRPAAPSLRKLMNSASRLQISCVAWKKKKRKNRRLITLVGVEEGTCFIPLSSTRSWMWWTVDSASPGRFLWEMPQQQNSYVSRDPAQGSASPWHKMDPNLRHKDWVKPAGGIAFPWEWSIPFLFTVTMLLHLLLLFLYFPSASPSSVCTPLHFPHHSSSTISIMIISVPT